MSSIKARIGLIVIVAVLAVVALGWSANQGLVASNAALNEITGQGIPKTQILGDILITMTDIKAQYRAMLVNFPTDYLQKQFGDMAELDAAMEKLFADYEKLGDDVDDAEETVAESSSTWSEFRAAYDAFSADKATFLTLAKRVADSGDTAAHEEAKTLALGSMRDKFKVAEALAVKLIEQVRADEEREKGEAAAAQQQTSNVLLFGGGGAAVLVAALGVVLMLSITGPLGKAVGYAHKVSGGDLSASYGAHSKSEVGDLTKAIEGMKDSLVTRIDQMREMAGAVSLAAEAVTSTSQDVASAVAAVKKEAGGDLPAVAKLEATAGDLVSKATNLQKAADSVASKL